MNTQFREMVLFVRHFGVYSIYLFFPLNRSVCGKVYSLLAYTVW